MRQIDSADENLKKSDTKAYNDKVKNAILRLKQTKNATDEQIQILAEMYNVDLKEKDDKER